MRQHSDLRCNNCKAELPKKLVYRHLKTVSTSALEQDVANSLSQKRLKTDETLVDQIAKVEKIAFPSLTSDLSQKLDDYISQLKQRKFQQVALSQSSSEKTRQNVRDNFVFALLLGVFETTVELKDLAEEEKKCRITAIEIEAAMYVYFKQDISKEYGRKFRLL